MAAPFEGFGRAGLEVLRGLVANNTRDWFEARKATYVAEVVEPAKALVVALADRLAPLAPDLRPRPTVDGSVFRLHRDQRFTRDAAPYKTEQAMFLWGEGPKRGAPGFYLSLKGDEVALGAGVFGVVDVDPWRAAVDAPASGAAWERAVADATAARGPLQMFEPDLKRVPAPYPADHPRAEWLRRKHVTLAITEDTPAVIADERFVDWCAERLAPFADVHRWLRTHLGERGPQR